MANDPIPNRIAYPGNVYVDPITGWKIEKGRAANLKQRRGLIEHVEQHPDQIPTLLALCRASFALWCNLFAWTYQVNEFDDSGREVDVGEAGRVVPFITWPVQDEACAVFDECINAGQDQLWDKSRKMGASWLIVAKLHHRWLFYKDTEIREMSRKEDYVDDGTSKSLFWKHRFINKHLPDWMRPVMTKDDDSSMYLHNPATGSSIVGESTNAHAMRGDRAWAILIDEAAAIDNLEQVLGATDRAGPRIFNSTPIGPCMYSTLRFSGKIRVVELPWWRHPGAGKDAELVAGPSGQAKWTSPAYRIALASRTPREVAQNWDMNHMAAGAMFFDPTVLVTHRTTHAQDPWQVGTIEWMPHRRETFEYQIRRGKASLRFLAGGTGANTPTHLKLWFDGPVDEEWRPVIGCDISHGMGASQSCAVAYDATTGGKLAELIDADLDPNAFADMVAMLGWWLGAGGGKGAALVVPENNGPGGIFMNRLAALEYPHIYRHIPTGKSVEKATRQLGWHSNPVEKLAKLGQYAQALMSGRIQNRSRYALEQCQQYVYLKSGSVGPGTMEAADGSAKAVHGDIVIADMLGVEGILRVGRYEVREHLPPPGSVAWHIRRSQMAKMAQDDDDY